MVNGASNEPGHRLNVTCRPARESDTTDVLEITHHIWDGEDYVPHVWKEWLADKIGLLAVAEHQGRVLGLSKLTQLAPGNWWMEGLRVHPQYEGRGIASQLHDYLLDYWRHHGSGAIRLATSAERISVHHLCERTGFDRVGEVLFFKADALGDTDSSFRAILQGDIPEAIDMIEGNPALEFNYGLMDLGWQWTSPDKTLIESAVKDGHAYWWGEQDSIKKGLVMYWLDDWENSENRRKPIPMIELFICQPAEWREFFKDFRRLAADKGFDHAGWLVPMFPELEQAILAAGFERQWEGSLYIFAKEN